MGGSGSEVVAETAAGGKRMWSHSPRKEASVSPPTVKVKSKSESNRSDAVFILHLTDDD